MFGFGANKKIQEDAKVVAEAVLQIGAIIRSSSSFDMMIEELKNWGFDGFKDVGDELDRITRHQRILFFRSSNSRMKNFKFWITYHEDRANAGQHLLTSENTGDYFGVMIFWSPTDDFSRSATVEISQIATKQKSLGRYATIFAEILVNFPGFTNNSSIWKLE
jgi:hypothetical protein